MSERPRIDEKTMRDLIESNFIESKWLQVLWKSTPTEELAQTLAQKIAQVGGSSENYQEIQERKKELKNEVEEFFPRDATKFPESRDALAPIRVSLTFKLEQIRDELEEINPEEDFTDLEDQEEYSENNPENNLLVTPDGQAVAEKNLEENWEEPESEQEHLEENFPDTSLQLFQEIFDEIRARDELADDLPDRGEEYKNGISAQIENLARVPQILQLLQKFLEKNQKLFVRDAVVVRDIITTHQEPELQNIHAAQKISDELRKRKNMIQSVEQKIELLAAKIDQIPNLSLFENVNNWKRKELQEKFGKVSGECERIDRSRLISADWTLDHTGLSALATAISENHQKRENKIPAIIAAGHELRKIVEDRLDPQNIEDDSVEGDKWKWIDTPRQELRDFYCKNNHE